MKRKLLNTSIVVISQKNDENRKEILKSLKNQKFPAKKEIIIVARNEGLAANMNYGIKNLSIQLF